MLDKISEKIANIIINGVKHLVKDISDNVNRNTVTIKRRQVIVNGNIISSISGDNPTIKWEGGLVDLNCDGSVVAENISGNVDCGGSVKSGDIGGDVDCGGSVVCGRVNGSIDAGGSVVSR